MIRAKKSKISQNKQKILFFDKVVFFVSLCFVCGVSEIQLFGIFF